MPASRSTKGVMAEIQRLGAQVEAFSKFRESVDARFSMISEKIGELRSMMLAQEKANADLKARAERAINVVENTHPESLLAEFKRRDAELGLLRDKLLWTEQMIHRIMEDMKDVKRTLLQFRGIEAMGRMSKEVKSDLVMIQKARGEVIKSADKVASIFMEVQRSLRDIAKMNIRISSLEENMRSMAKSITSLEVKSNEMVTRSDFARTTEEITHEINAVRGRVENIAAELSEAKKLRGRWESEAREAAKPEESGGGITKAGVPRKILK